MHKHGRQNILSVKRSSQLLKIPRAQRMSESSSVSCLPAQGSAGTHKWPGWCLPQGRLCSITQPASLDTAHTGGGTSWGNPSPSASGALKVTQFIFYFGVTQLFSSGERGCSLHTFLLIFVHSCTKLCWKQVQRVSFPSLCHCSSYPLWTRLGHKPKQSNLHTPPTYKMGWPKWNIHYIITKSSAVFSLTSYAVLCLASAFLTL